MRETIDNDGEVISTRTGHVKEHPAIRGELANRQFITKTLMRLGLDVEPLRASVGRPGGVQSVGCRRGMTAKRMTAKRRRL
jgi:hypothetical protein